MVVTSTARKAIAVAALLAVCAAASAQKALDPGGPGMPTPTDLAPRTSPQPTEDPPAAAPRLTADRAAIAIAGGFVFVVQGGMLYQFAIDGLKPVAAAPLVPTTTAKAAGAQARGGKTAKPGKVGKAHKAGKGQAQGQ